MNFLVLVLVLLIQHGSKSGGPPDATPRGYVKLFQRHQPIGKLGTDAALLAWLLIPLLLIACIDSYLRSFYSGQLIAAALFAALVFFTLGYRECRQTIELLGSKKVSMQRIGFAAAIAEDASHPEKYAFAALATLRYVMVPLFWTFLFGAYGAVLVLLVYTFVRYFNGHATALTLARVLEWIPVRLLLLSYTLDCCFEKSWQTCKHFSNRATSEQLINEYLVPQLMEQSNLKRSHPTSLLPRQIMYWLAVMAIMTLLAIL